MKRIDGRQPDELRPVKIERNFLEFAEGSVLITCGKTRVICAASVDEEKVPPFIKGTGTGWITSEYSLMPRSTLTRTQREITKGRPDGRTTEIQRLIGRAVRSVVDNTKLGERTIWLDCDVLQADGGTRTVAITGAFVALVDALRWMKRNGWIQYLPVSDFLAATSVGKVDGEILLDLCYEEDSRAEVDMNIVMTGAGKFVEIQGTGEKHPFSTEELKELLLFGARGVNSLIELQKKVLGVETIEELQKSE